MSTLRDMMRQPLREDIEAGRAPTPTLRSYTPPMSRRIGYTLGDILASVGVDPRSGQRFGSKIGELASLLGVDAPGEIMDARRDYANAEGFGGKAAALAAAQLAVLGALPMGNGAKGGKLAMDEASRMARAKKLGFDVETPVYHGTGAHFDEFKPSRGGSLGPGVYVSPDRHTAESYGTKSGKQRIEELHGPARMLDASRPLPDDVLPYLGGVQRELPGLEWRGREADDFLNVYDPSKGPDAFGALLPDYPLNEAARKAGYDGISYSLDGDVTNVVFNPAKLRRRNAAFDPAKRNSSNLLAGALAGGLGYGMLAQQEPGR